MKVSEIPTQESVGKSSAKVTKIRAENTKPSPTTTNPNS